MFGRKCYLNKPGYVRRSCYKGSCPKCGVGRWYHRLLWRWQGRHHNEEPYDPALAEWTG